MDWPNFPPRSFGTPGVDQRAAGGSGLHMHPRVQRGKNAKTSYLLVFGHNFTLQEMTFCLACSGTPGHWTPVGSLAGCLCLSASAAVVGADLSRLHRSGDG